MIPKTTTAKDQQLNDQSIVVDHHHHLHHQPQQNCNNCMATEMSTTSPAKQSSLATSDTSSLIKYKNLKSSSIKMNGHNNNIDSSLTNGHCNHEDSHSIDDYDDDDYSNVKMMMGDDNHNNHLAKCSSKSLNNEMANNFDEIDHSINVNHVILQTAIDQSSKRSSTATASLNNHIDDDDDYINNIANNDIDHYNDHDDHYDYEDDDDDDDDKTCIICNCRFDLSKHKHLVCKQCSMDVCFKCSLFIDFDNSWICTICHERTTSQNFNHCQSWICRRIVKQKNEHELLHFSNAKQKLLQKLSSINDNSIDLKHQQHLNNGIDDNNGQNLSKISHNNNDNHNDQQNNNIDYHQKINYLTAIRSDMELDLAKLLGIDTIDYTHIGYIFNDDQYHQMIKTYTPLLANLLISLQQSIHDCDCGRQPKTKPTDTYNQLEEVLNQISVKSFEFTSQLQLPKQPIRLEDLDEFIDNCESYEHLLAQSIVNQIIEDGQSRFMTTASTTSYNSFKNNSSSFIDHYYYNSFSHNSINHNRNRNNIDNTYNVAMNGANQHNINCCDRQSSMNDELSYEIHNNDDDDLNAHNSSYTINYDGLENDESYDDNNNNFDNENDDDYDEQNTFGMEFNFEESKVYFPEAGLDLIDSKKYSASTESNLSQDSGIKLIDNSSSWQDNWLFKKNKDNKLYNQYHMNSDIHYGYLALALAEPVPMLIPNPSQSINPMLGDIEADRVSDLSEHLSETNSIVFSSDDEDNNDANDESIDNVLNDSKIITDITPEMPSKSNIMHTVYVECRNQISSPQIEQRESLQTRKNKAMIHNLRWTKIKVPDYVPSELRTICNSIPNPRLENLDYIPTFMMKPGNASLHSGILAQFCCKAKGLLPLYFAWYKDGHLIAASADESTRNPEEIENRRLARTYFGLHLIHRRYIESNCSTYRLIVFNDNECILEIKKSNPMHAGIYSVVAYNHVGHDWCDFKVTIDRQHYSAVPNPFYQQLSFANNNNINNNNNGANQPMSPRPILRRPQNKSRKINGKDISKMKENPQISLTKLLKNNSISFTNNKQSSPPLVILQTWEERQASNLKNQKLFKLKQRNQHQNKQLPTISHVIISIDDDQSVGDGNVSKISTDTNGPKQQQLPSSSRQFISTNIVHSKKYGNNGEIVEEEFDEKIQVFEPKQSNDHHHQSSATSSTSTTTVDNHSLSSNSLNDSINIPVMPIAEREHRKWNNPDVNLLNNPYSPENIEKRSRSQKLLSFSPELNLFTSSDAIALSTKDSNSEMPSELIVNTTNNINVDEEFVPEEKRKFFHSARDLERYKRNYYIPKTYENKSDEKFSFSILSSLGGKSTSLRSSSSSASLNNNNKNDHEGHNHNNNNEINNGQTTMVNQKVDNEKMMAISQIKVEINNVETDQQQQQQKQQQNDNQQPTNRLSQQTEYSEISVKINNVDNVHADHIDGYDDRKINAYDSLNENQNNNNNNNGSEFKQITKTKSNDCIVKYNYEDRDKICIPISKNNVKNLKSLFSSNSAQNLSKSKSNSMTQISTSQQPKKMVNHKNYAVYSLTGRSIPREICVQNQKNLPKFTEQNRIDLANKITSSILKFEQKNPSNSTTTTTTSLIVDQQTNEERQGLCDSNSSLPSMESNDSLTISSINSSDNDNNLHLTNGKHDRNHPNNNNNNDKKTTQTITSTKQRAIFWEKRIETNQISDSQVLEEFPTINDDGDGGSKSIVSE